jgi:hypothetical protein
MDPISKDCIAKSVNFVNSLQFEEIAQYCESISHLQPYAFLNIIKMLHDGVSTCKISHAMHMLMVIHKAFYFNHKNLPIISKTALRDAFESNVAMLQSIERGWLTHEETLLSYPERNLLAFMIIYLKNHGLVTPSEENERLVINLKTVLDAYIKAKEAAAKVMFH